MARRRGRGGYQKPSKPAAVSGPGKYSARTDGGPADMLGAGLGYGERKQIDEQVAAAPLQAPQTAASGGGPNAPAAPRRGSSGIFGPSDRPGEPLTAGVDFGPGAGRVPPLEPADDTDYLIRAAISKYPHLADHLIGLLNGG